MSNIQRTDSNPPTTIRLRPSVLSFWGCWLCFFVTLPGCVALALLIEDRGLPSAFANGARLLPWMPFLVPLMILWKKYNVYYELRPDTIAVTNGILSFYRKYSVTRYSKLLGVEAQHSVISMLFSMADLSVGTADTGQTEFVLRGVRNWRYYLRIIQSRIDQARIDQAGAGQLPTAPAASNAG